MSHVSGLHFAPLGFVALVSVIGCGGAAAPAKRASPPARQASFAAQDAKTEAQPGVAAAPASPPVTPAADRQIIYLAEVSLVATDFAQAEERLPALVRAQDGFVAQAAIDHTSGARRSGRWTLRIPSAKLDPFLASLDELGFAERRQQTSEDVTEECVDLDARIVNAKRLETGMARLLETRSGAIKEVIEVERELARIRGEIERMEGRRRMLADRVALSTVTLHIREEQAYTPPAAPTFVSRAGFVWSMSWSGLQMCLEESSLAVVAIVPWLAVFACLFVPARLIYLRRLASRLRTSPAPP